MYRTGTSKYDHVYLRVIIIVPLVKFETKRNQNALNIMSEALSRYIVTVFERKLGATDKQK